MTYAGLWHCDVPFSRVSKKEDLSLVHERWLQLCLLFLSLNLCCCFEIIICESGEFYDTLYYISYTHNEPWFKWGFFPFIFCCWFVVFCCLAEIIASSSAWANAFQSHFIYFKMARIEFTHFTNVRAVCGVVYVCVCVQTWQAWVQCETCRYHRIRIFLRCYIHSVYDSDRFFFVALTVHVQWFAARFSLLRNSVSRCCCCRFFGDSLQ